MQTKSTATPKLYIGLDIHKRSWKIKTATDLFDGRSFSSPPQAASLKQYVDKHFSDHHVIIAYEAGCFGYTAHRQFVSYGWDSIVFNPADLSKTGLSQYQKTDSIDAGLICRELKDNRLTGIYIPDEQREQLRCLFRRRVSLVKDFRAIKSEIKMELLYLGISIPERYDKQSKWRKSFIQWISELRCKNPTATHSIQSRLSQYKFIDTQIREVSNDLRAYCRKHYKKDYYLLRSVPGIGALVACGILSELGDLRRFKTI